MARSRHPNKHIEKAVAYSESVGWTLKLSKGHAWGRLFCPFGGRGGCIVPVWSTPRNCENHARHITREVDSCPHHEPADETKGDEDEIRSE